MEGDVFVVNAYRWGIIEKHSYTVGVFNCLVDAINCAKSHAEYRGGKYVCLVEKCVMNDFRNEAESYTDVIYRAGFARQK